MHMLIYRSEAVPLLPFDASWDICQVSSLNNKARGITGFLVEHAGVFLQVLEGPGAAVDRLFETIRQDERHREVTLLLHRPIRRRQFGFWAMNFGPLNDEGFRDNVIGPIGDQAFRERSIDPAFAADVLFKAYVHALRIARRDDVVREALAAYAEGVGEPPG